MPGRGQLFWYPFWGIVTTSNLTDLDLKNVSSSLSALRLTSLHLISKVASEKSNTAEHCRSFSITSLGLDSLGASTILGSWKISARPPGRKHDEVCSRRLSFLPMATRSANLALTEEPELLGLCIKVPLSVLEDIIEGRGGCKFREWSGVTGLCVFLPCVDFRATPPTDDDGDNGCKETK